MAEQPERSKNPESEPVAAPLMGGRVAKKKDGRSNWTQEMRDAAAQRMRDRWKNPKMRKVFTHKGRRATTSADYSKTVPVVAQARRVEKMLTKKIAAVGDISTIDLNVMILCKMIKGEV